MDAIEQIATFKGFIELEYLPILLENARKGNRYLVMDFRKLARFNVQLSEDLLDSPEDVLKAAEMAIEQFDLPYDAKNFTVRFSNLSDNQKVMIRDIRSRHLGKFIKIECIVRQKSDVRPQITSSRFECPSCGNVIPILQLESKFKEPTSCACGRKGKFKLLHKELVDAQSMTIEEDMENIDGGEQPKKLKVFLKSDLVSPLSEKKTNPGAKIIINGYLKEVPVLLRTGGQSTRFDLLIEANYIEPVNEDFGEVKISKAEEESIKGIAKRPDVLNRLVSSIAPSIYGHDDIKEALLVQLVGGVKKIHDDGTTTRGDMHIMLVGDPGAAKSQLLKRISMVSPKARFISATGASGAGLTATVVKDDFIGGWALEAGAIVLANKGLLCLDELDKIGNDETGKLHEALEGQTVTVSKANIQATMRCETTVLAAANPKHGRFDPYAKTIAEQIEMPSTLINRFDLIFPIKDIPDHGKDKALSGFILEKHKNHKKDKDKKGSVIETEMLRKFIAYARKLRPELSDEAMAVLQDYYLKMRDSSAGENGPRTIPISARQLEGLVRMSEAYAKIRLAETITAEDARKAVDLMNDCLRKVAMDGETGKVDIDRIATGVPASKRNKINIVKNIIVNLESQVGKTIPVQDILALAEEQGINEDAVNEAFEFLKRSGDIFEPRRGFISRIS